MEKQDYCPVDLLKEGGFIHNDNSVSSNGGEKNVTVGGNGNNVNVNADTAEIVKQIMKKDHEEHTLILRILELEKEEKDQLFHLYEALTKGKKK